MYVDRLVEGEGGERVYLATRPHWFSILRHGLLGVTLIVTGLALILFGEQLKQLIGTFAPRLFVAPDGNNMALPAPVTAGELQASLHAALAWGVVFLTLTGVLLLVWALLERHFTENSFETTPL